MGAAVVSRGANLKWESGPGYRSAALSVNSPGRTGFSGLPPQTTGINFTNLLSKTNAAANQILLNGSGVAAGDVDGDGWCDLYFCRLEGANVLYRNLGGWRFEETTSSPSIACEGQYSTGAVFADVDGDRDLDLLVNSVGGGTRLFINDGQGHFTEAADSGLLRRYGSTSLALADIDGDGDLDLYVANYRTTTVRSTGFELLNVDGRRMVKPVDRDRLYITPEGFVREHGEVDAVYLNDGRGRFQLLSWTDGNFLTANGQPLKSPPRDWALSAVFRDIDGDGDPDIYVCNDFWSPDKIWLNDGTGRFREMHREALPNTSTFSMCADFADINRDGLDDFIVLDMQSPDHVRRVTQTIMFGLEPWALGYALERPQVTRNTLFLNRGDGTYAEIAQMSGVHATDWSWSPIFLDIDLDGYEDLLIATGNTFDTQDQDAEERIRAKGPWPRDKVPFKLWMYPPLQLPKVAFRNRGNLTFEDVSNAWGFNSVGVAQGMCLADLDNDGDQDVIINQLNNAAALYRNESSAPRVMVRLSGDAKNTRGTGARIRIEGGAVPIQSQEIIAGGRYLSGDDPARTFAAGSLSNRLRIEVRWRSGKQSVITGVKPNRFYEVQESSAQTVPTRSPIQESPVFVDVSDRLGHVHPQIAFDDWGRQPLLPNKLSQLGPGIGWFDVDSDGWEDLIIASGRGGLMGVYRNDGKGGFNPLRSPTLNEPVSRSQSAVIGWRNQQGQTVILAGSSNYEDGSVDGAAVRQYNLGTQTIDDSLPGNESSTGPLALADIDGDGDLDLFVGGRVKCGRYPEAASSRILRNEQGTFRLDTAASKPFEAIGLISGAMFTDIDNDGDPDLILACEWGPIRILKNQGGQFKDATATLGLDRYQGWWTSVATGDLDGDGRLDIIAGNWGRNTQYEVHRSKPLRLYYGDFNQVGHVDLIEAYHDNTMNKIVPERAFVSMANALPFLRERFATHKAFAEASVSEILGDRYPMARELTANILESVILLNRGDRFTARALPVEVQIAPVFGICVGDLDGDGSMDVFLSQNFFATQPLTSPYDAGRGLWLRGNGKGEFQPIPGQASGLKVYGEQRGCALADYDHDGRLDLVVTQNAATTRLFHNQGAKPGLRVRLKGPVDNPNGIGARIWIACGQTNGAVQEIHAGSGYWSQDAATLVFAIPNAPAMVCVRWPWAQAVSNAIPSGAREIVMDPRGIVERPDIK